MDVFRDVIELMKIIANIFTDYCVYAALINCMADKEFMPTIFKVK